jgi:Putative Ig domain
VESRPAYRRVKRRHGSGPGPEPPGQGPGPGGQLGRPHPSPPRLVGAARPAHSGPRPHRHRHHEACRRAVIPRYPGVATGPQTELPEVVLPATAKIGDPSAGQVSYTLDQTTVAFTSGPPPAEATVGAPYTFSFTASGSPAPTFALASGRLPDGLTLDAAGKLSGAPTTAGTHTFTGTATNPAGAATGGPYTITVDAKPAVTSGAPPAGSVGVPYDFAFTASGVPAPTFTLASGALPGGLALDQDGRLHGTPTREGSYTLSVSAQNRAGSATAGPYTMVIDVPLGVDQVVSFDRTTSAVQLRSPAMAVSAGELVLAHVSADGPSSRRQQVTSLTGGGLRWSLAARSNTGRGTAEIWQASTTQAISQLRVTAKLAHDGYHGSITVASFKGRQVVGATSAAAAGLKGAPGVTLTPSPGSVARLGRRPRRDTRAGAAAGPDDRPPVPGLPRQGHVLDPATGRPHEPRRPRSDGRLYADARSVADGRRRARSSRGVAAMSLEELLRCAEGPPALAELSDGSPAEGPLGPRTLA